MAMNHIVQGLYEYESLVTPNPLGDPGLQDWISQRVVFSYMRLYGNEPFLRLDQSTANRIYALSGGRHFQRTQNSIFADNANEMNKGSPDPAAPPPITGMLYPVQGAPDPPPGMSGTNITTRDPKLLTAD
jgi:hypothetical protein